jgi:hypothetical protein
MLNTKYWHLYVPKYKCTCVVPCTRKQSAIRCIKRKLNLTWLDDVILIGVNL